MQERGLDMAPVRSEASCIAMPWTLVLGHETVGVIERAGAEARKRWGLEEGDRVALEEYLPCGHCAYCRAGDFRLCEATDWRSGGLRYGTTPISVPPGLWGGYAQYQCLHPGTVFHRVPDGLEGRHAALALPIANGIEWAYLHGCAGPGDVVLIQGPGQQGLACVAAAREAGAAPDHRHRARHGHRPAAPRARPKARRRPHHRHRGAGPLRRWPK
jgi:threonine dehydrogenase-like Zn-dependent dehydrogenase